MNVPLAFLLVAAIEYFAVSVVRSTVEQGGEPRLRFDAIRGTLEALAAGGAYVRKQVDGSYLIWPRGLVRAIHYDGSFATYIQPVERSLSFRIVSYMYARGAGPRPSWQRVEDFTCTSLEFGSKVRYLSGLPPEARFKLMSERGQSGGSPLVPPHRSH